MKKINRIIIIFTCMLLIGCNKEEIEKNNDNGIIEQEIEEQIIEKKEINITKACNNYDDVYVLNDTYLAYKENDKYGIIDYNEEICVEPRFEYIGRISEKGYIVEIEINNDKEEYILLDEKLNKVFSSEGYEGYITRSYNENILELYNKEKNETVFLDGNNNFEEKIRLNAEQIPGYIANASYKEGKILIVTDTYSDEGFVNFITLSGDKTILGAEDKMIYTYLGCAMDNNGWIVCYEVEKENISNYKRGFYNTKSNIFCEISDEYKYVVPFKLEDNIYYASYNNYALVKKDEKDINVYVYDIIKGEVACDNPYEYVELQDYEKNKILFNENGKWGYLNKDFKLTGNMYIDATSFNDNGYALVNIDNVLYVIDEQEEIISEPIEGKEAVLDKDIFIITSGEKKYFIKVK